MSEPEPRVAKPIEALSLLTCPQCGSAEKLSMPADSCLFFHECRFCGSLLRPLPGDCCVFCSYGSVKCPPKQAEGGACCGTGAP
jgi:hypothetical protein